MASKRTRVSLQEDKFINQGAKEAYAKMRQNCGVTDSKILRQDKLSYQISDLFSQTPLLFFLSLAYPFHSEFIFEFYANLTINSSYTTLQSRISHINVEITKEDLASFLHIPNTGPSAHLISQDPTFRWSRINSVIRNSNLHQHHHSVTGLVQNARVIQHVLRHTIIPKAGDRTNITPLLSLVTFYCMTNTSFDVADLLIRYIDNLATIRDPRSKRKQNLALGHILAFIIQHKYSIGNVQEPDHLPSFFSDHSFHTLYGGKKQKQPQEEQEEEEGGATQGETSAPPHPPPDEWTTGLHRLEQRLEQHIEDSAQRWRLWEQQRQEDRAWLQAQFDSLRGSFPPPDQESSDD